MNIINLNFLNINPPNFSFKARKPKTPVLKELAQDVVEISKPKRGRPKHIIPLELKLTSLENSFLEMRSQIKSLYWRVSELEALIRDFPREASINREERRTLMKEIRTLEKKLNKLKDKIVKEIPEFKEISSNYDVEKIIKQKKMYNTYSKKISDTTTKNELEELTSRITFVFENAKSNFKIDFYTRYDLNENQYNDLMKLIKQRKQEIKTQAN